MKLMQGNDNFVRVFKQKDKDIRKDTKRDKNRSKDSFRKLRKIKLKEMESWLLAGFGLLLSFFSLC